MRRGLSGALALVLVLSGLAPVGAQSATLTLTWADNASNESGFYVERRVANQFPFQRIQTLGVDAQTWVDATVTDGESYCYRVQAFNGAGDSTYTNEACAVAQVGGTVPLGATGVTVIRREVAPVALAFVQSNSGSNDASGTALGVALTGVGANNLIVIWFKHEGAATTYSISDGTTTLTNGTIENHTNGDLSGLFAYLLVANSGNKTYTMTLGASRPYRRLHVWEFSYSGTASLDAQNTAEGATGSPVSGTITTTGTDEVVLGGYGEYSGITPTVPQINNVNATGSIINSPAGSFSASWYRILAATFAGGAADLTDPTTANWICNIIAFKVVAAAAEATPRPVIISHAVTRAAAY